VNDDGAADGRWYYNQVFLATKFAVKMRGGDRIFSNEPEYIRKAIDISLERLKTDKVDLWYWSVSRMKESLTAFF